jgi:hypothetical protein
MKTDRIRRGLWVALIGALLMPQVARAADPATVIAAFNSAKAECRYLVALCTEIHHITSAAEALHKEAAAPPADGTTTGRDAELRTQLQTYATKAAQKTQGWHDAVAAVTAKRGQRPACAKCSGVE